jgi:phosphoribosylanthranilate isomerase
MASIAEAQLAVNHGVDAVGLVGKMPNGPGPIPEWLIEEIVQMVPAPIATFLLTSEQSTEGIIHDVQRSGANTVQIVDEVTSGSYSDIRNSLPYLKIVQVIHVMDEESIETAIRLAPEVDALLLDSGNTRGEIKTLGGTGIVHNWDISRQIVLNVNIPVFLAGGLTPQNVRYAIEKVRPFGVDVCSGVRTAGKLDRSKVESFMHAVRSI